MLAAATTGPSDQFWKSAIPVIPPRSRSYQLHTGRPSFKCAQPALLHLPAVHESLRRRRFRSTLDILVRDSSACHERRGKPRRTRMSIVRLATSQPVSPRVRSYCCYLSSCCQNRPNVRPAGDDTRSPPLRGSHPRQPPHHKGYQADDAQKNITLCFGD